MAELEIAVGEGLGVVLEGGLDPPPEQPKKNPKIKMKRPLSRNDKRCISILLSAYHNTRFAAHTVESKKAAIMLKEHRCRVQTQALQKQSFISKSFLTTCSEIETGIKKVSDTSLNPLNF